MTLRPTVLSLKNIFQRAIFVLTTFLLVFQFFLDSSEERYTFIIFSISIYVLVELIPTILYSWKYYRFNKNDIFEINHHSIKKKNKESEQKYYHDDIEKIDIYMSVNNPRFHMAIFVMDLFHFAKVIMKNGESIIITSICHHQVDLVLEETYPNIPMEYKWGGGALKRLNFSKN